MTRDELTPFVSEVMLPVWEYIIETSMDRVLEAREYFLEEPDDMVHFCVFANEIIHHWNRVKRLSSLASSLDGATYLTLAYSNGKKSAAEYLEWLTGVNPILNEDKFNSRDFCFDNWINMVDIKAA